MHYPMREIDVSPVSFLDGLPPLQEPFPQTTGAPGKADGGFAYRPAAPRVLAGPAWRAKLVFDRILAALALLVLAPLIVLVAAVILATDGRPILFLQPRFGRNGTIFEVMKFRTMRAGHCDRSGSRQTADDDARITPFGLLLRRTSIDELPQLLNVLKGDMNITGPRAHPCGMMVNGELCERQDPRYHLRHRVAPGLTGWAQVNHSRGAVKSPASLSRRISLDLEYIDRWSPNLEVRILWRTIRVVFHADRGV